MPREMTNKLYDLVDEGVLTWEQIGKAALSYMSERDVADMAETECFVEVDEEPEEEDDGQPTEMEEWHSFDPDC
jgi:hypothetical protein